MKLFDKCKCCDLYDNTVLYYLQDIYGRLQYYYDCLYFFFTWDKNKIVTKCRVCGAFMTKLREKELKFEIRTEESDKKVQDAMYKMLEELKELKLCDRCFAGKDSMLADLR